LATQLFNIDPDYDFGIVGISSQDRDFRLAWALNLAFDWNLSRVENHEIPMKSGMSSHAMYEFKDEDNVIYTLLSNKGSGGYLLPIDGYCHLVDDDLLKAIRSIPFVLAAIELNGEKLKTIQNLITE
jgi:hypothetical protein